MSEYAAQRFNMVESQIRVNDVTDLRVHAAMREIPREKFVPANLRSIAYAEAPIEVVYGRYLLEPRILAKLIQLAEIRSTDNVLDVACATGYSTVVLAMIAGHVTGLEQDADLVRVASETVTANNATIVQGSFADGFRQNAPYDVVLINGAVEEQPGALLAQLAEGGRCVCVVHSGAQGMAHLFVRENGRIGSWGAFDASSPVLAGFRKKAGFVF